MGEGMRWGLYAVLPQTSLDVVYHVGGSILSHGGLVCVCVCVHPLPSPLPSLSLSEPDTPKRVRREVGGYDYFPPHHPLILTPYSHRTLHLPTSHLYYTECKPKKRKQGRPWNEAKVLCTDWFLILWQAFYCSNIRDKCWGRHSCRYWAQMRDQGHNG